MGPEIWDPCVTQVARGSSCGRRRGASSFAYVIYSQHDGPASPHTLKTYTNAHHGGAQMEYDAGLGSVHCPDTHRYAFTAYPHAVVMETVNDVSWLFVCTVGLYTYCV